jgi:hypothetical protein
MDVLVKIWLSFVISMKYVRCVKIWPFEWNSDFRWSFVWNIINVWKYGHLSENLTWIGHLCEVSSMPENMVIWVKIWLLLVICVKYPQTMKIWWFEWKFDFHWSFVWNMVMKWKFDSALCPISDGNCWINIVFWLWWKHTCYWGVSCIWSKRETHYGGVSLLSSCTKFKFSLTLPTILHAD